MRCRLLTPKRLPGKTVDIHWKARYSILHDGKVFFTAQMTIPSCLNLADGKFLWKASPQDDIYLAGIFDDKCC